MHDSLRPFFIYVIFVRESSERNSSFDQVCHTWIGDGFRWWVERIGHLLTCKACVHLISDDTADFFIRQLLHSAYRRAIPIYLSALQDRLILNSNTGVLQTTQHERKSKR